MSEDQYSHLGAAVQDHADPELTDILNWMVEEIRRHVILDKHLAETVVLWIMHAHAIDAFRYSPRLSVRSPLPNCGKTTLLAVIRALCGQRGKHVSNLTIAAYFRYIEGISKNGTTPPVMLIDEVDTFLAEDRKEVFGILNSGHDRKGARILRCLNSEANHEPREYSTWAPLVLGGIGGFGEGAQAAALESRCLTINLRRKRPNERVEKLLEEGEDRCARLAEKAAAWSARNIDRLRRAEPAAINGLYDRALDSWSTLFAIADASGGAWAEAARDAAAFLSGEAEDPSELVSLLRDCRLAFGGTDRITSSALLDYLHKLDERPWGAPPSLGGQYPWGFRQQGKALSAFGIKSVSVKFPGGRTERGFYRAQFKDAWASYLPGEPEPVLPEDASASASDR